jgi:hypothetical protein
MKKLVAMLALAVVAGTMAQAQVVTSRNAVGYVKLDLFQTNAVNRYYLFRNDFVGLTGPMTIANTISNQVPTGSTITFWDDVLQQFKAPITRQVGISWGGPGTNQLPRGMCFFLRVPSNSVPTNFSVYIMGEVPDSTTAPTTTLFSVTGYNFDGYPYPVSQKWTNTQYAKTLTIGSQIIAWNSSNQVYGAPITKSPGINWGGPGNALVIDPGTGFLIKNTNTMATVNEAKPYTWP